MHLANPNVVVTLLQVSFSLEARTPAYDGTQLSGYKYHSISPDTPLTLQLGQAQIPPGLEAALCYMSKGEKAVFIVPAQQMCSNSSSEDFTAASSQQLPSDSSQQQQGLVAIPAPPSKAAQVELCVQLHDLVQVSMMGDPVVCSPH